jgi:hypothetical protein
MPGYHTWAESTRKWLSGRASPCQGEGRGFESRLPLQSHPGTARVFSCTRIGTDSMLSVEELGSAGVAEWQTPRS